MSSFYHLSLFILGLLGFAVGQEQLLMVFGGEPTINSNKVTLLSLDGGPPVPSCLQNLNPLPKRLYSSCAAALGEGKLLMKNFSIADIQGGPSHLGLGNVEINYTSG